MPNHHPTELANIVQAENAALRSALQQLVDAASAFLTVCDTEFDLDNPMVADAQRTADQLEDILMACRHVLEPEPGGGTP